MTITDNTAERPKYVYVKPNGKDLFFKGPKTGKLPLPRLDAPDFHTEYHKLLGKMANNTLSLPVKAANRKHINYGGEASVGALAKAYFASGAFLDLDPRSQHKRRRLVEDCLRTIHPREMEGGDRVPFSEWRIDEVTVDVVRELRDALVYVRSKFAPALKNEGDTRYWRDSRIGALRVVFGFGVDRPYRWVDRDDRGRETARRVMTGNPFSRLRALYSGGGFRTHTDDDVDTLEAYMIGERLHGDRVAFGLARYCALRRSDILRLGKQHVHMVTPAAGGAKVRALVFKEWKGSRSKTQARTNKERVITIAPALWEIIEKCPGALDRPTFVADLTGKQYADNYYGARFGKLCITAGLPKGSSLHGLRHYVGTRMADKGATPHQIAAMLGHQDKQGNVSIKNVLHYTRKADKRKLTAAALGFVV